jgi:carboxypeptidase C (cathepsin A)
LGVSEDLESIAAFIDRYLTAAGRRTSPKYLAGESYGGFRAARLPELLAENHSLSIAGVFLVSPVLEFSLISGDTLALLPDVLRCRPTPPSSSSSRACRRPRRWPRSSASRWALFDRPRRHAAR